MKMSNNIQIGKYVKQPGGDYKASIPNQFPPNLNYS